MSDSFVDLLETSLEVPDFDLGEMRRADLFAAAMQPVAVPENVVPFPCADDDEQAAFDWLMGERPADVVLMDRLVTQPEFHASVVAQHGFLRELRSALRLAAAPALARGAEAPRRTARVVALMLGAMAASFAAMFAMQMPKGSGSSGSIAAKGDKSPSVADITLLPSESERPASASGIPLPSSTEPATISAGVVPAVAKADLPAAVETPEGIEPVRDWQDARLEAAREVFGQEAPSFGTLAVSDTPAAEEPAFALAGRAKSSDGGGHDGLYAMTAEAGLGRNNWYYWSGSQDGNGLTVPEPGGCLPVMVGCLLLWWRRRPVVRMEIPLRHPRL